MTNIVPTTVEDVTFFAIKEGRKGHSRFVKGREPQQTNYLCVFLEKRGTSYLLLHITSGKVNRPEPWSKKATQQDLHFWKHHAYLGRKEIIPDSQTKYCPWVLNTKSISNLHLTKNVKLSLKDNK